MLLERVGVRCLLVGGVEGEEEGEEGMGGWGWGGGGGRGKEVVVVGEGFRGGEEGDFGRGG